MKKASIKHFEAVYNVITRLEDLSNQVIKNDMIDVFSIPSSFILETSGNHIPSPSAMPIQLFSDANQVDLQTVCNANTYYIKFGTDYHGENVVWSGEKILHSCDPDLRDKLVECTRNWPEEHKGGPTYLKLLLSLVLQKSHFFNHFKPSLLSPFAHLLWFGTNKKIMYLLSNSFP
jgi:hypothetical protein